MIKTFTQTDLVRYLYHETTEEENNQINRALLRDSDLRALYNEVRETLKDLDAAMMQPSESTIEKILDYSKSVTHR